MTKKEVLELLNELFQKSARAVYAEDDPSGCRTTYIVDQEAILHNVEAELEKCNEQSLSKEEG